MLIGQCTNCHYGLLKRVEDNDTFLIFDGQTSSGSLSLFSSISPLCVQPQRFRRLSITWQLKEDQLFHWPVRWTLSFRSLWSDISLFQGGPLTNQQSPVSFPKELYRRAHNATVISGSMHWSIYQCFLVLTANNIAGVPPSVQVDFQLAFLRDSLKLIKGLWLKLFQHDELSSVTWGTTNTEHFLMTILRQHREVKRCVSQQTRNVQLTPTHPISIAPSDLDTGTPPVSMVGKLVVFECSDTQWNSLKPTQEWDICWEGVVWLTRRQMFQRKSSMKNWKGLSSGMNSDLSQSPYSPRCIPPKWKSIFLMF